MISMIQYLIKFFGLSHENPNQDIENYLELCDTLKFNRVNTKAKRIRLSSFSLRDKAKAWVQAEPPGSFTTWDQLSLTLRNKYFLPLKFAKLRNEILSFQQQNLETLYDARERYMKLLKKCPNHQIPKWVQLQTFYNGLQPNT